MSDKINIANPLGKKVTVSSPATVANMVCGFDILGFAVNSPSDVLSVALTEEPGVHIINEDEYDLPTDPEKNVSGAALLALLDKAPDVKGLVLILSLIHI